MKGLKAAAITFVTIVLLLWLGFSFAQWDINPARWGQDSRFIFVMLAGSLGFIVTLVIVAESNSY